jgi:hypothetical protein
VTIKILITGARAPAAVHFARVLSEAGHEIILADSQRFPLGRATKSKKCYIQLPPPIDGILNYGKSVQQIVNDACCDLVIPTCEEIFFLAACRDLHGFRLPLLAPSFKKLETVHNKYVFAVSTQGHPAQAAQTQLLTSVADVAALKSQAHSLVFKPVWSRFATQLMICPSQRQLETLRPSHITPWIAQTYLTGEELCCWAFVKGGRIITISSYRPLHRVGLGAAIAFEPVYDPNIAAFVKSYCRSLQWDGQISFDFRRDAQGKLHVLECNPRATSGVHFFGTGSGLANALISAKSCKPNISTAMTLPLALLAFGMPKAFMKNGIQGALDLKRELGLMVDISTWPDDRSLLPMQILGLIEVAFKAFKKRKKLTAAATYDIEWNGGSLRSLNLKNTPAR